MKKPSDLTIDLHRQAPQPDGVRTYAQDLRPMTATQARAQQNEYRPESVRYEIVPGPWETPEERRTREIEQAVAFLQQQAFLKGKP